MRAYTAFGERTDTTGAFDRHGYVGLFGYQADEDFSFLHVGARYYDPASVRFLQRDPLGIEDGTNVYEYVRSAPTLWIDWDGTARHRLRDPVTGRFKKTPWWKRVAKKIGKRVPIYLAACVVARIAHKIADKPYEDPHDVILDIIDNLIDVGKSSSSDKKKKKENPGAFG